MHVAPALVLPDSPYVFLLGRLCTAGESLALHGIGPCDLPGQTAHMHWSLYVIVSVSRRACPAVITMLGWIGRKSET